MPAKPTISNTLMIHTSKDKLFLGCFIGAMVAGMAFSLGSVGYLLGFNATTLALYGGIFTITSLNWITRAKPLDEQLAWCGLAAIPIFTRMAFNMPLFREVVASMEVASVTPMDQVGYMAQIVGLWLLVAVCEEGFRATMFNALMAFVPASLFVLGYEIVIRNVEGSTDWDDFTDTGKAVILVGGTLAWLFFHFFQRLPCFLCD